MKLSKSISTGRWVNLTAATTWAFGVDQEDLLLRYEHSILATKRSIYPPENFPQLARLSPKKKHKCKPKQLRERDKCKMD